LDFVDLFLGNENLFYSILEGLQRLPDLERMLSGLIVKDRSVDKANVTVQQTAQGIESLIAIKTTLENIPSIAIEIAGVVEEARMLAKLKASEEGAGESAVDAARSPLQVRAPPVIETPQSTKSEGTTSTTATTGENKYQLAEAIIERFAEEELGEVLEAVKETFTESTVHSKNKHAMRHQECFALRPGTDGMMDVLRKAFLANVDDIYTCADKLADTAEITVSVRVKAQRGYYLCIPIEFANHLPNEVIQPVKSGKFIHCTTNEVFSLNARAQENVKDLLVLTNHRIQEVLDFARERIEALCNMTDAIALLDLCHGFADVVASSRKKWCRPVVAEGEGSLAIKQGRYAIDFENLGGKNALPRDFVPNDTFANQDNNFTLVSGVNGGGKSTYLKQIGLIVVLAQIGCYVPAEEAFVPLRDMLCTR
jgi:DNA mismatch repair protein MSH4